MNKSYLGDLVNFQNGYAFKSGEYANKGHNLIRIKNVQQGFIEMKDECFVKVSDETKFQKFVLNTGDIVISLTGNVGRIARIEEEHLPAVLNQRVATIAPKNLEVLDVEYLYFLLRTPDFLKFAISSGKGAAQQNVSTTDMEKFECYVPSLKKQREIVEKLNKAFSDIDALGQGISSRIDRTLELFSEVCLEKSRDLNPTGFKSLKEIASLITKGTTPTSLGHKFTSSGINFLKVESLDENGVFIKDKFAYIDSACHDSLKRSQLEDSDVLVSIAGALGRTAIVTADICPANVNQALSLIRLPKDSEISPNFLFALFQAGYFKIELSHMGAGAAQQNLSLAQIGSLKVPVFSDYKQIEFIDFLSNLRGLVDSLKNQLDQQNILKLELWNSILTTAFMEHSDIELVT